MVPFAQERRTARTALPERHRRESDLRLLASRLRAGAWIVLIGSLGFVIVDASVVGWGTIGPLLLVKIGQCLILIALLYLVRKLHDEAALRWTGAVALSALYLTTIASGVLRDEVMTANFLVLVTVLVTATFVPWGARAQLLTATSAAVTMTCGWLWVAAPAGPEVRYRWLATAIALFGSVWMARTYARQRREQRLTEGMLATESRVSAALARAGEEMIRNESTPGILDSICGLVAELLSCDQTALVLYDAGENAFAVHSSFGHRQSEWDVVRAMRVPARTIKPLLDGFNAAGAMQVDSESITHPELRALHERHRVARSLYVPLRHAGEIIGIISAHYRDPAQGFSDAQQRVAIGVAHLASMVLQNTRLLDELREANRLKSDFVATMSHELRTPVSVILGYTEMLADAADRSDRAGILARIRRSGLELLDLVEETLNLSRLEAGRDPPLLEPVQVPQVFADLVAEFAAMVPLDDVALRWEGPEDLVVRTDRRKLRMILKNLLGNALKFTVQGEVVLACSHDRATVRFVVRDTGVGIAPHHLPIIFDMFRQADSSDARSFRGAGLGLYIVQRLVHQLGGEIVVSSQLGRGSAFTFTLPIGGEGTLAPSAAGSPERRAMMR